MTPLLRKQRRGRRPPAWLPNAISTLRIVLVPVFVWVAAACSAAAQASEPTAATRTVALVVLLLIGVSDLIDGHLARTHDLATHTGAILDAFADKLAQVVLLIYFSFFGGSAFPLVPVWFTVLVLGRDVVLGSGTLLCHLLGGVEVVHRSHGRLVSTIMFVLLVGVAAGIPDAWVFWSVTLIAALVIVSAGRYFLDGYRQFAQRPGSS